ncbi:MAG TPA: MarR family transcriptional regulator [Opitutaceae bacterium]|nr:MarR family transcriptional regulator [Opitutaceae bacterium]
MGTHFKGSAEQVAALDAYIKLVRSTDSLTARVHTVLPADLTITQFGVLEALHHLGPMCPSEIAGKVLKSAGNLTLVIENLTKADLVRRERNPDDRRFFTIHLTAKGEAFIRALFPKIARAITAEFGVLSPAEQTTLAGLCRKLGRAAAA